MELDLTRFTVSIDERVRKDILRFQEQLHRARTVSMPDVLRSSPVLRLQEEWQRALLRMQEQLRLSGAFGIQEALRHSPVIRMQEEWQRNLLRVQEQLSLSGVVGIQKALRDSLGFHIHESLQRDLRGLQEQLHQSGLLGIEKVLRESTMASLAASVADMQGTLSAWGQWASLAKEEAFGDALLGVGTDGSATLNGETATASEIEQAFQELVDQFHSFLTDARSMLHNLKKPVRALILWFISTVLVPALISYHFQQQSSLELQQMQQQLQLDGATTRREIIAAVKRLDATCLDAGRRECRVVIGDGVRVRLSPNRRAPVKRLLPLGAVVHFIEKDGPWTAVDYLDQETGDLLSGWVFNKYLKRLE